MNPSTSTLTCATVLGLSALQAAHAAPVDYSRDIQPLIAERCLECHGPDKQKGKLRLDRQEGVLKVVREGELISRITTNDPDDRMPPKGKPLTADQVAKLKSWVKAGARIEQHWAYRPLQDTAPPRVKNEGWVSNPIDRLVLAQLERSGLKPAPEADRTTLIKRLHYDLLGLPAPVAEVDAFVNDKSPNAWPELVRRLLESRHFGERWGRHWLDKARYADSDGYEKDRPRQDAWNYRDWVIQAVNDDMPMDRFTVEQLAGDLLPDTGGRQKLATAFHRQTLTNTEGGTDQEEFRNEAVFDRTETTGTIWLGLTLTCARCHTHKYDSIPQAEYYRLFAFFNNADETNHKVSNSKADTLKYEKAKAAHEARLKAIDEKIRDAGKDHAKELQAWEAEIRQKLAGQNPPVFHDLQEISLKASVRDVAFQVGKTGIIQVSGTNPANGMTYELSARARDPGQPVTGLRIDVFNDKRLPRNGPGRAENGNFVLSEVELHVDGRIIGFSRSTADFSQRDWQAGKLVDGKIDAKNGWAISNQMGRPHHATLILKEALKVAPGTPLKVRLIQNYGKQHFLGRFQVRLMTGEETREIVPDTIRDILVLDPGRRNEKQRQLLTDHFLRKVHKPTVALQNERTREAGKAPKAPAATTIRGIKARGRTTRILQRGDFLDPGDEVKASGLTVLPPIQGRAKEGVDRLDLANWLMSAKNPLTPRVLSNHVWEKLFGQGLVGTLNDFGVRGEPPTHPQLLDWLGQEYRRLGWSRKKMIETIVLSSTYRQSSAFNGKLLEIDPENHFLARQNRFRVEAEIVRDLSLSVSGLLSGKIGGPSVFPPMPPEVAALSYANSFKWKTSNGEDRHRRGMYTFFKRTAPHPNLIAFDCPDSNTTNVQRRRSNTPIQALTTLNNNVFTEASQAFGSRILELKASSDLERIQQALRMCIARAPTDFETRRFLELLEKARTHYREDPAGAAKLVGTHLPKGIPATEAAPWVTVTRIILNLDEFITRE